MRARGAARGGSRPMLPPWQASCRPPPPAPPAVMNGTCTHPHILQSTAAAAPCQAPHLCRGLDEHDVQLARLGIALLDRHLPLVHQVCLVAHQHDDHIAAALRPHLLHPPLDVEEGLAVCATRGGWRVLACMQPRARALLSSPCRLVLPPLTPATAPRDSLVTSYTTTATDESRM